MNLRPRQIALVTGGAGFLGSHVIRAIARDHDIEVIALDNLSTGILTNVPQGVTLIEGDITDTRLIEDLFLRYRFSFVYHFGAFAAEGLSHFVRRFTYFNNIVGSANLINEAVKAETQCFVFASSIAVYGDIEAPMSELNVPSPKDPYGISKLATELDLKTANEMFGLNYVTFRLHNVYGTYQNVRDPYRNVVGIFMKQIRAGEPITIFGDGSQQRAFTYVEDIAPIIARAPLAPGAINNVINLGSDRSCSVYDLARAVAVAMGEPNHPVNYLEPRNEVRSAYGDHSRARAIFGPIDDTSLPRGLCKMSSWARSVDLPPLPRAIDIEVRKNMPPHWV